MPMFYDQEFNHFYHTTPIARVIKESFFVEVDSDMYYVITQDSFLKEP